MMIPHNKLVRDKVPAIIEATGATATTRKLTATEYPNELRRKLLEEAADAAVEDDVTELTDVLEVVYALAKLAGVSEDELNELRSKKAKELGTFSDGMYLIETTNE